ncbi:MAG TPA: NHLP family bacteriocin export ABC transporter peptidase/permease/ATPase subunit, partial [Vicinamibacterales bacterium]|nr:NHLP family bacteriocin export ABC transporter peptidase/permease/ATPase subunit [Vicinamibacterales bacterium]
GVSARAIVEAGQLHGLRGRGVRIDVADFEHLPRASILHWNFSHFIVFDKLENDTVWVIDPAFGRRPVPMEEARKAFTGVALVFEKGPEFSRGGEAPGLLAPLRRRLAGSELALTFVVAAGLALMIPGLVTPSFQKVFVDEVLVRGLATWVKPLLLVMTTGAIVTFCLNLLQQRYLLRLESRLSLDTSSKFFWHVLRLPIEFFTQRYAGEIGSRVAINDRIAGLLSGELATTTLNLLVIALYAVLMFRYDGVLSSVAVTTALLNIVALKYASRRRVNLNQRMLQDRGKMMGTAMGGLQTIETLKASGSESDFFARWSGCQAKVVNADQDLKYTTLLLSSVPPVLTSINTALILGIGGLRVIDGHLTIGMLVAFQGLMLAFIGPVNKMVDLGSTLQEVRGDMNRLEDVLRAEPDRMLLRDELPADGACAKLDGHLELRNVSFGYSRLEPPLIDDFNLVLPPGSRVALVGRSGSGKSTVGKLVAGLYEPWTGDVLFDGQPRSAVPRAVMTASVAVVDQDVCMFEDTVRENLTLWDRTVPDADVMDASKDASIHEDITSRTGGYASPVEEGGRNFSGGQRQRMEIARALVGNPRVLVLDEATSALDPSTEKAIDDHLRRRGCTCLIVAHRLSTIRDCDEIIVMHHGHIVQRGTHQQLAEMPGTYRDLIASE